MGMEAQSLVNQAEAAELHGGTKKPELKTPQQREQAVSELMAAFETWAAENPDFVDWIRDLRKRLHALYNESQDALGHTRESLFVGDVTRLQQELAALTDRSVPNETGLYANGFLKLGQHDVDMTYNGALQKPLCRRATPTLTTFDYPEAESDCWVEIGDKKITITSKIGHDETFTVDFSKNAGGFKNSVDRMNTFLQDTAAHLSYVGKKSKGELRHEPSDVPDSPETAAYKQSIIDAMVP